ncbi:MAG TPA: AMP-binding protein [Candidatus Binatia bacterium]|nr:AMP-binding protein [Candidatus Binatia bacterium]
MLDLPPEAPKTLTDAFLHTAVNHQHKGITYVYADGTEIFQSYAALLTAARCILAGLRERGLRPRDRAILQIDDLQDYFSTFWACLLAGIIPVTVAIAPSYSRKNSIVNKLYNTWELLGRLVVLSSANLVQSIAGLKQLFATEDLDVVSIDTLKHCPPTDHIYRSQPNDLVFLQLTSGSTGTPKCIQETHRGIISHIHGSAQFNHYTAADVCLNWLPLDHVVPLLTFHLKDVYLGCQQVQVSSQLILAQPLKWLDLMEAHQVTHTWSPNFGFKLVTDALSRRPAGPWNLSSLKRFMNAGEQVTVPVVRDFLEAVASSEVQPQAMQPAFGMAEVCTCMTYQNEFGPKRGVHRVLKSSLNGVLRFTEGDDAPTIDLVDLGPPIPGVQLRIVSADDHLLSEGVTGRLQIKGDVVTPGYLNNDVANQEAFTRDGWFNTGDLGFLLNGRLTIAGRQKEVIIIRGANFHCYEIEDVVSGIAGVEATFVAACGVDDPTTGTEGLAIFFVPEFTDHTKVLKNVLLLGHLDKPRFFDWLAQSDIIVFPSQFESFSITLREAMLLRKTVVVSPEIPLDDIDREYPCSYALRETTAAALADAILGILSGAKGFPHLSEEFYQRLCDTYDIRRTTRATIDFYEEVRERYRKNVSL